MVGNSGSCAGEILPVSSELVDGWQRAWRADDLANTMLGLADRFWVSLARSERDAAVAWHHLLLAVGSFKRQTPIRAVGLTWDGVSAQRRASFDVPGLDVTLAETDEESWKTLAERVHGIGVATTTTLLSALWPESHVVIDRFAFRAAIALRASVGLASRSGAVRPEDTHPIGDEVTWNDYRDYRQWVLVTAGAIDREAVKVERTLFLMPRLHPDAARSWRMYGEQLLWQTPP